MTKISKKLLRLRIKHQQIEIDQWKEHCTFLQEQIVELRTMKDYTECKEFKKYTKRYKNR